MYPSNSKEYVVRTVLTFTKGTSKVFLEDANQHLPIFSLSSCLKTMQGFATTQIYDHTNMYVKAKLNFVQPELRIGMVLDTWVS